MLNFIRGFDASGARLGLNFKGESEFKTTCGGFLTLCLQILSLAYFAMRLIVVIEYDDANIGSYEVFEDRGKMFEELNFADLNFNFFFCFVDTLTGKPMKLDPRIGQFEILQYEYTWQTDGTFN